MTDLYPHPLPLILLLLFFATLQAAAQSVNSTYPNCPSYNCGNITVGYPFWNIDSAPSTQFCGYEGFGMNCTNNGNQSTPSILFGGYYYQVRSLNYELRKILLTEFSSEFEDADKCPGLRHGIDLDTSLLSFSTSTVNLSFHVSCNGCPSFATEIPCFNIVGRNSCVHIVNTSTEEADWGEYSCRREVATSVLRESITRFPNLSTDFVRVLEGGFELEWTRIDGCDKCEESNGRCGSHRTTGFICFCSDGSTSDGDCKGDNTANNKVDE